MNRRTLPLLLLLAVPLSLPGMGRLPETAGGTARPEPGPEAFLRYRQGLLDIVAYGGAHPEAYRLAPGELVFPEKRRTELVRLWARFLDYLIAVDSIGRAEDHSYREGRSAAFHGAHAAFLAEYRSALGLLRHFQGHAHLDRVLNEPSPELGLPAGTYDQVKFRFLNVLRAAEFARLEAAATLQDAPADPALREAVREDAKVIWRMGLKQGPLMTAENALAILKAEAFTTWFPVQKGVANLMGETKVYRWGEYLISEKHIHLLREKLKPGDVLLSRREWYLTNVGIPGYWSHAALYIGTLAEQAEAFGGKAVSDWIRKQGVPDGRWESLLQKRFPGMERDQSFPILEAIADGVVFTPLSHATGADSLAVLRPRLTALQKAQGLLRAFSHAGKPYDYDFDFNTDAALVCSELVYKAYEPGMSGLRFPMELVMGRPLMTPNALAQRLDETFDGPDRQWDVVAFLDGSEGSKGVREKSSDDFRPTWKRPKWHIVLERLSAPQ